MFGYICIIPIIRDVQKIYSIQTKMAKFALSSTVKQLPWQPGFNKYLSLCYVELVTSLCMVLLQFISITKLEN